MKKIISFMLILTLLLVPITSFADSQNVGVVDKLSNTVIRLMDTQNTTAKAIVNMLSNITKEVVSTFKDVSSHWANDYISALNKLGVIEGYSDGTFKPDNKITVAEFTTLVTKSLDIPAKHSNGKWYQGIIDSAMEKGIIYEGEFTNYDKHITRGEMARIVVRALGENPSIGNTIFKDDSKIPSHIKGFAKRANELKVINGYPDGTFKHDGNATRAEATTVIVNVAKVLSGENQRTTQVDKFIEPELVIAQNVGLQNGSYYFGVQIANIDEYSNDYMFKAECTNFPELNTMQTWHVSKGTYYIDRTEWKSKNTVASNWKDVITVPVFGNNLDKGDTIIYKITVKKGMIEHSYMITGMVMESVEK